jgi:hypothetical protein
MNEETTQAPKDPAADDTVLEVSMGMLEKLLQEKRSSAVPGYQLPISPRLPAVPFEAPFDLAFTMEQVIMASSDGTNLLQMLLAASCLLTRISARLQTAAQETMRSRKPEDLMSALSMIADASQMARAGDMVDRTLAPALRTYYQRMEGIGAGGEKPQPERLTSLSISRGCLESLGLDPDEVMRALQDESSSSNNN